MRPYCEERWVRVKNLHERNIDAVLAVSTAPVICLYTSMKALGIMDACRTEGEADNIVSLRTIQTSTLEYV